MDHAAHPDVAETIAGAPHSAPQDATPDARQLVLPKDEDAVGRERHSYSLRVRVERVTADLGAGRPVSDDDLQQHARDCTFLMESAYDRFQASGDVHAREEAYLWMNRRDEALRCFSPAWKARREAQIQQAIADGVGFFVTQGELDRAKQAEATGR